MLERIEATRVKDSPRLARVLLRAAPARLLSDGQNGDYGIRVDLLRMVCQDRWPVIGVGRYRAAEARGCFHRSCCLCLIACNL